MNEMVLIIDFGGQYNQLIARRVRDHGVYCEVVPYRSALAAVTNKKAAKPIGIIFTGGPAGVYTVDAPTISREIFNLGIPILGICYGAQLTAHLLGGTVEKAGASGSTSEFGKTSCFFKRSPLFDNTPSASEVWMSHNDFIKTPPPSWSVLATTAKCPVAAFGSDEKRIYAVQFHPEVTHTDFGKEMLRNFLYNVCKASGDWQMSSYADTAVKLLKDKIGGKKALLALSGGVDSSVACALLTKACGKNLHCIFVDHGLMRQNEGDEIEAIFGKGDINFVRVNAADRFLAKLAGVTDPEQKRKIIGAEFISVFEEEAKKIGAVDFLAQGTIYPDVIESGTGDAATIKSHHNVGGLPEHIDFKELIEPLRLLFKDEVRRLGTSLGLPKHLVNRQPFPGPGLAIRIIGEVTREKLTLLKQADYIFRSELEQFIVTPGQYFAVLTDTRSVGVTGDERSYGYTCVLRAVNTDDFMTADFARLPYDQLSKVSTRIVNEVSGIGRVCYDITSKPPATIEWE
jgi:GMP synthase (glutamine-hydrolysing)